MMSMKWSDNKFEINQHANFDIKYLTVCFAHCRGAVSMKAKYCVASLNDLFQNHSVIFKDQKFLLNIGGHLSLAWYSRN